MKTAKEMLDKEGFDFPAFEYENEYSAKALLKAMEEYRNQEPKGTVYVPVDAHTTRPPKSPESWLEETTLPIADIAGKAWDSGWQYGHADGAGIMEFINPQTKEQFMQSINQSTKKL